MLPLLLSVYPEIGSKKSESMPYSVGRRSGIYDSALTLLIENISITK
jgi:hypothetical protein